MIKKIACFLSACCILSSMIVTTPASAVERSKGIQRETNIRVNKGKVASPMIVDPVTYTYFSTLLSQTSSSHVFFGYHPQTPVWSTASSYTLTSGVTVGTSVSGGSILGYTGSTSSSISTTVGVTMPANPLQNSRVAIYADYKICSYRIDKVYDNTGSVVSSSYITVKTPTSVYQTVNYQGSVIIPYPGYNIQYGSTGAVVTQIQNRLNTLGFSCGTADGDFGSMTKSAVTRFQTSRGISADGVVGPTTWDYLFNK